MLLKPESGLLNRPEDLCGSTNRGVTKRVMQEFVRRAVSMGAMKALKPKDVKLAYKKLYSTTQWRNLRGTILSRDQCRCQWCGVSRTSEKAHQTLAAVHHKTPHKGNLGLF